MTRKVVVAALVAALVAVAVGVGGRALVQGEQVESPAAAASAVPGYGGPGAGGGTTTALPPVVPHEIVFLGDSITDLARSQLEESLHAAPDDIRAVGGIRIEDMQYAATALRTRRPEQVVINLGTNNVLRGDDTDHAAAALAAMVAVYPEARCVHVVTVNEEMLGPTDDVHGGAVRLNERIRQMAAADPRVRVIDWAGLSREHDVPSDPAWPVTTDAVHPSPTGQRLLLDAYRQSIAAC